ncbi:mitochondrial import inner membrane translocase subunit Tim9 [Raphidocelis subcapitata]|uniref:Mitochondrial import inner membrane translocase subunit n=1 Tax=Raphidocelis subcapitata TaxID=307507 RepID=A0A2V0PPM2_9CHLO|nr:mitochondrial import inner membrane translocase subunit Tim9 [Raphidocelis subcapitata]|eukprot:GBG00124.1 mitochondrial import inner membrane translocase subunit Tim9 [Raphidocelis subcapitata]
MNFSPEAVAGMSEDHKAAFLAQLEHMQIRDSMRLYNNLVQRCFNDCVDDFRSKHLTTGEEKCVTRCCEKFLNLSARTGQRFQELFSEMEQKAAEAAAKGAKR